MIKRLERFYELADNVNTDIGDAQESFDSESVSGSAQSGEEIDNVQPLYSEAEYQPKFYQEDEIMEEDLENSSMEGPFNCSACPKALLVTMKDLREHLASEKHAKNVEKAVEREELKQKRLEKKKRKKEKMKEKGKKGKKSKWKKRKHVEDEVKVEDQQESMPKKKSKREILLKKLKGEN